MAGLNVLTWLTAYLDECGRNGGKPLTGPARNGPALERQPRRPPRLGNTTPGSRLTPHSGQSPASAREPSTPAICHARSHDFPVRTTVLGQGITIKKRMRAKLREVKEQLKRRRHEPIPMAGAVAEAWRTDTSPTSPCPAISLRSRPSAPRSGGHGTGRCGAAASAHA